MWNRCHWRLLFNVAQKNNATLTHIQSFENGEQALVIMNAMNVNEGIYKFATHCGHWNWGLIVIVLVSGMECGTFVIFSFLWILHYPLDYRWYHVCDQEGSS